MSDQPGPPPPNPLEVFLKKGQTVKAVRSTSEVLTSIRTLYRGYLKSLEVVGDTIKLVFKQDGAILTTVLNAIEKNVGWVKAEITEITGVEEISKNGKNGSKKGKKK